MKKKLLSYISAVTLLLSAASCTNLDENVYDKLPADEFGNKVVEINALIGTAYNTLKTYWPGDFMYLSECGGSMAVTPTRVGGDWYDGGKYRELFMHTWTAHNGVVKDGWNNATKAIGTCNITISTIENTDLFGDADKNEKIAEMRGVRAFWIYTMLDYWGNIPLVISYDDKELPETKSRQEVYDWLIKEVTEIADICPKHEPETYGKFTQGAAYSLLAKLYLNAEAWKVNAEDAYNKCVAACDKVLAMSYVLESNWKANFVPSNDNSKEAIFAICFSSSDTENQNQMMRRTLHYNHNLSIGANFSTWNGVCAQPEFVKLFDEEDPRYKGTFSIGQLYHYETGEMLQTDYKDPLNYTVDIAMIYGDDGLGFDKTYWGSVVQEAGARCDKWDYAMDLTDAMENDFHIFRLADIYLTKAEALLRGGGSAGEATNLVNAVRERAYGHSDKNYSLVTLEQIALERKFELAWEAWSRQDDIRFGTYEQAAWDASNCTRLTNDYLKLYPVPQDAWQKNQKLKQNDGYPVF